MDCDRINNNNNLITIKVSLLSLKGEVKEQRRFSFPVNELTVGALYEALGLPLVLAYTDAEGDCISVRTQPDLDEMLRTRQENTIRMHATVSRSLSGNTICAAVKPAVRAVQKAADSAVETAKSGASSGAEGAKSVATSTAIAAKRVAEEALVLGVRGYSLAYNQIYPGIPDGVVPLKGEETANANVPPTEGEPACPAPPVSDSMTEPPALSESSEDASAPPAPLSGEFVKLEGSAPPVDLRMESLLNELEGMGFSDRERNRTLLNQNKMDLASTVAMLLDSM